VLLEAFDLRAFMRHDTVGVRASRDFELRESQMSAPRSDFRKLEKSEHTLFGGILYGVEGRQIELQARFFGDARIKSWEIDVIGMAKGAIQEVSARIAGAFSKYGLRPPSGSILINLAPAGLPKYGTSLDLSIALFSLLAAGYIPDFPTEIERTLFFLGELSLHGEIRRIQGALPIALAANPGSTLIVPSGNAQECRLVRGLPRHESTHIGIVDNLEEVLRFLQGHHNFRNVMADAPNYQGIVEPAPDFSGVKGQEKGKRAMLIAAAGGHNVLMIGPPGEGKTTLASALRGILPPLSNVEKIELTRIYSAKGLLTEDGMVVTQRPFRSIHHSASKQALVGGGSGVPGPGEITLAHRGVLFLDELAEFSRATLESLRQPMEAGNVTISRVDANLTFPAQFTVVAAMNPCPCGFHGQYRCMDCLEFTYNPTKGCTRCGKYDVTPRCSCKPAQVERYRKKISGPILDWIDLHVEVRPLSVKTKFEEKSTITTAALREKVRAAREMQRLRFGENGILCNAAIPGGQIMKWCEFLPSAFDRYKNLIAQGSYSTRATDRMAKIARTIADLDRSEKIDQQHIQEAADFITGSPLR
jgi:magnesium chelatase family protein